MASTSLSVSLVIPNWNGVSHLPVCLDSIRRQTRTALEVLLVDNGSTDSSLDYVRQSFPEVVIIALGANLGFAAAVNRGIQQATGDCIALLNNDIELAPEWIERMLVALTSTEEVGSAACKMLRYDDRTVIDAAGDSITRGANPLTRGSGLPDNGRYDHEEFVFGTCAGAAIYRKDLFSRIGMFDESFISYYEDADLSFRAQLAGFKCVYVSAAVCYHKRGATAKKLKSEYPILMQERNLTAFQVKNIPTSIFLTRFPVIIGSRLRRLVRSTLAGVGFAAWRGFVEGFTLVPEMLRKRREIQQQRIVSIDYILSFMQREV